MLKKLKNIFKRRFFREFEEDDVTIEQLQQMQKQGAIILDVRSPQEYNEGHINGAILIPEYEIKSKAEKEMPNKDAQIVVCCSTGLRSKRVQRKLNKMGYKNVFNLYNGTQNY